MIRKDGIPVSGGIAICEAFVLEMEGFRVTKRVIGDEEVVTEIERFHAAQGAARREYEANRDNLSRELGAEFGNIFQAYMMLADDPRLNRDVERFITENRYNAEYAVSLSINEYVRTLHKLNSNYIAARVDDFREIEKRLLRHLLGGTRERLANLTKPVVVVAPDLTPSETANLKREFVYGFATEHGGKSGHTAILASGLEIPAVVGVGSFLQDVVGGDTVIIDGDVGLVIIRPDDETLESYRRKSELYSSVHSQLQSFLVDKEAITLDGYQIQISANIELPDEVEICKKRGAEGIGLFRTEFLYMTTGIENFPKEDIHFKEYKRVLERMYPKPVTIRTFDFGSDKAYGQSMDERNPALGLRSIRLAFKLMDVFRAQLRAALRASIYGKLRIMFPMITSIFELRQVKMVLYDIIEELKYEGEKIADGIEIGMMIEVPSTCVLIDQFAKEVDFFSIGTNDLVQYTLAVDRDNREVTHMFRSEDPAVLRLLQRVITVADQYGRPVSLCGQMSSDPVYTMLLIGLGLREFSCMPSSLLKVKRVCRGVTTKQCVDLLNEVMKLDHANDILIKLKKTYADIFLDRLV
jgi:phosphotransferase system enzyme I (PtsI)